MTLSTHHPAPLTTRRSTAAVTPVSAVALPAAEEPQGKQPTVAEALCEALKSQGVSLMFGYPGGAILPFYDALHRCEGLRHVLVRHEQGAVHAADGYARATRRVGVCVATSGPGATNLVTGLATAMMDGVPVVAITGQVPTFGKGQDFFQESDILGITIPVTKHGFLVERPDDLWTIVDEAFALATAGRPGPVLIDIPKDVQNAPCRATPGFIKPPSPDMASGTGNAQEQLERAAALVNTAERPVVMAGRGVVVSDTTRTLLHLAEQADLPVVTTLLGLDGFPASHPLCIGLPGMHGTVRANMSIQEADVILGLGVRFDDRVIGRPGSFAPNATIIHADISPASVGRTIQPHVELIGDLRQTLPQLASKIDRTHRQQWWARIRRWPRECAPDEPLPSPSAKLTGRQACRELAKRIAASGATVVTDVGQHQMWLAQELLDSEPGTHLTSGGLGAMGYALPAALGAALGRPDRPTWAVAGDGGFQMTLQELATIVQEAIPLRVVVINNGYLGMVRQWQELYHGRRYSASELSGPNLPLLAQAYGIPAQVVTTAGDLHEALEWADTIAGPSLLDLRVVREENVYPIVPPGAALDELVTEPRHAVMT